MRYFLKVILSLALSTLLSGCNSALEWHPPIPIPIAISVNSAGEIGISSAVSIGTPIGTFTLTSGTTLASLAKASDRRMLIVRLDDVATVYPLEEGKEFSVVFEEDGKLYSQVALAYESDGNIVLEIESISSTAAIPLLPDSAATTEAQPAQVPELTSPPLPLEHISLGNSLQSRASSQKPGAQVYSHLFSGKIEYTRISVDDDLSRIELVCTDSVTDISSSFSRIPKPEGDVFPNFESKPIHVLSNCRIDFFVADSLGGGTGITIYADVVP